MKDHSEDKAKRILAIYTRLSQGKIVYKAAMSDAYGVSQRTIQRDITDIQCFLQDQCMEAGIIQEIIFDKRRGGYLLQAKQGQYLGDKNDLSICRIQTKQRCYLNEKDILIICRILLGSGALIKEELFPIIESLIALCDESQAEIVDNLLQKEIQNYTGPQHERKLIKQLWNLEMAVHGQKYIKIVYNDSKECEQVVQKLRPVRIIYVEGYFYLVATILDKEQEGMNEEHNKESRFNLGKTHDFYQINQIQNCIVM